MASPWPHAVATVRRSVDAFNMRDTAAALDGLSPDSLIVPVPNYTPAGAIYRGRTGAESYFRTVLAETPDAGRPATGDLRALFEKAPAPTVVLDDNARILDANAAACALFGLGAQRLRGRNVFEFVAAESVGRATEFWRAALARGQGEDELPLVSHTGERHPVVEVRARADVAGGRHMAVLITERRRGAKAGAARLTPREREVFRLLAAGLTARGIGDRLGISPNTVRTHVQNGTVKLEARSRVQAVAVAVALGEIDVAADGRLLDSTYVQTPTRPSSSAPA